MHQIELYQRTEPVELDLEKRMPAFTQNFCVNAGILLEHHNTLKIMLCFCDKSIT